MPPPLPATPPFELRRLWVQNYRSLRNVWLDFGRLTVVVGPNGSGKSNLYRALQLLCAAALGRFRESVVEEGGIPSVLWAGPRISKKPVRMTLGLALDDLRWEFTCGLGPPDDPFQLDPRTKRERVWHADVRGRNTTLVQRVNSRARIRDESGRLADYSVDFDESESLLSQLAHPAAYPELSEFVDFARQCRFYENFPVHASAPTRYPCVSTRSEVLSNDGANFAAAWETAGESALQRVVADAFPGWDAELVESHDSRIGVELISPHLARRLRARELSDGMLRYLLLAAALHVSRRPARFLAFNEPEASLNPSLLPKLARMFHAASRQSQILVVTHSHELAQELSRLTNSPPWLLAYDSGGTRILDQTELCDELDAATKQGDIEED